MLVDYSSSPESSEEDLGIIPDLDVVNVQRTLNTQEASRKKQKLDHNPESQVLLPAPDQLLTRLGGTEDAELPVAPLLERHQGRVRSFPHIEGNYPTVVFLPVTASPELDAYIARVLKELQKHVPGLQAVSTTMAEIPLTKRSEASTAAAHPSHGTTQTRTATHQSGSTAAAQPSNSVSQAHLASSLPNLGSQVTAGDLDSWHVSLSRCVGIRFPQISPLMTSLRSRLGSTSSISFSLQGLEVFLNDDASRAWVALSVSEGKAEVCKLVRAVNKAFAEQALPPFHKDPRPHISFGWVHGGAAKKLEAAVQALPSGMEAGCASSFQVKVSQIICRVGQRNNVVWSSSK